VSPSFSIDRWVGPAAVILLATALAGCGAGEYGDGDTARHDAAQQAPGTAGPAVERPVAKPMDRGARVPSEMQPVERPVVRPPERVAAGE